MPGKKLERGSKVIAFCLLFFLFVLGCAEKPVGEEGIGPVSEFQSLQPLYSEAGLSSEEVQRIDSSALLEEEESGALGSKLAVLEQKLGGFRAKATSFTKQREKNAQLALIQLELVRTNYLKAMVELKNAEAFSGVIEAFKSFDFSKLLAENKCLALERAGALREAYLRAQNSAEALKSQIISFNETYAEFSQAAGVEESYPGLEQTALPEFVESANIVFEGCNALIQSMAILSEIEQAAQEQNLCFALKSLGESIESLDALALRIDSVSERAASLKELGIDSKLLEEERKALLSISTEFREFQSKLGEECG